MKMNGKYQSLLRADRKPTLTVKRALFYLVLLVSLALFISFFTSLSYSQTFDRSFTDFNAIPTIPTDYVAVFTTELINEGYRDLNGIIISLPTWGIVTLITSGVGFGSTILSSTLSKTMLLENKKWLKTWTKKGKITYHYFFKMVKIDLGENRISILKLKNKYRIKIQIAEGLDLSKYGFSLKNNYFVGYFVKEELSSTIHLLSTQLQ